MSFRDAVAELVTVIRNTAPTFELDIPYVCDEDETGYVRPLEELAGMRHRAFDFRTLTYSRDDGEASFTTLRFRARMGLRVCYLTDQDRAWLERMIHEDIAVLTNSLINPNNYHASVVSIPPPGEPTIQEIKNNDPIPRTIGWLLTIPFDLIYLSVGP